METAVEVRAQAKWVRTSPRKARLVVEHIRGRSVPEARTVLAFTTRAAARDVENVLRSAVANAEANHGLIGDDLYVSAAYVDEGPTLKRWRPRARGRAARIRKHTCHITVKLAPIPEPAAPTRRQARAASTTVEEKPKRARRARQPAAEQVAEAAVVEDAPAAPPEEKPKRTRRTAKPAAEKPVETPAAKEPSDAEPATEEEPKRSRASRAKKTETTEEAGD
jgi:large subunit ribosomal protein L22